MRALQRHTARLRARITAVTSPSERGDVPGWVLITLMTAGLVAALWAVAQDQLQLPFEQRQKSRLRARLVSGEEVALALPRGEVLRGGDLLLASDGRVVEVVARPERLLHVE